MSSIPIFLIHLLEEALHLIHREGDALSAAMSTIR